jgi:hypothetical protein
MKDAGIDSLHIFSLADRAFGEVQRSFSMICFPSE